MSHSYHEEIVSGTLGDVYRDYLRFVKKGKHERAYRCLERMLGVLPEDVELLQEITNLCLVRWKNYRLGKRWAKILVRMRARWPDYVTLAYLETNLGDFEQARKHLKKAAELQKKQPRIKAGQPPKKAFFELGDFIRAKEAEWHTKTEIKKLKPTLPFLKKQIFPIKEEPLKVAASIPSYTISVKTEPFDEKGLSDLFCGAPATLKSCRMLIDYIYLTIQREFDELLCLQAIKGVEKYWYQIETVKKVLKHLRGRVLLCDEVGLGKTIETGMLIKEYCLRGMAKNVLILTPPSLVSQWQEEMETKFSIRFITTEDPQFTKTPENFWKNRFIIASLHTAKTNKNVSLITNQFYDIVVVDEAHHLRNKNTLAWKLINLIEKRFIFLLTATPIQNDLIELFNLITLLKVGEFKTQKLFRQEYVQRGNRRIPTNKEGLQNLLRNVMIRNTRSAIDLKLPQRFAVTIRLEPTEGEKKIFGGINDYLKKSGFKKPLLNLLLREAGSSPFALKDTLLKIDPDGSAKDMVDAIDSLPETCKGKALIEILRKNPENKKIIFTQFRKSVDYLVDLLRRNGIPAVTFRGDMSPQEKDVSVERFRNEALVLVSTETGGEGRNMQFCNTIINFDLPWNPMRIEQRIGRLHRIGQKHDVFIFNLSVRGTIEDYIIDILDNKINMFQMVIGEIEPIMGHLGEDKDFEEIIMELWLKSENTEKLKDAFQELGNELLAAKNNYLQSKILDNEVFGQDYET
ncbi:MAG: DEAD/DEAH box helicase family protein [Candidatus Omnitrophica bacterium]|nr:DEAD/DEAH box helicase family protein [Candidatus Omnitrophota bacterium]